MIQALVRNAGTCRPDAKGEAQAEGLRQSERTDAGTGAESRVVGLKVRNGTGPKGRRRPALFGGQPARGGLAWIKRNRFVISKDPPPSAAAAAAKQKLPRWHE